MTLNMIYPPVLSQVIAFSAIILAGQNSVTITHNFGRLAKINGVYGIDDEAVVFKIINETNNSFDVAAQGGFVLPNNTGVEGTYV